MLRVGVLPDQNRQELEKRYLPLLEHLSKETKISFKLTIPGTYDELVKMFEESKIDLARFGGVTFVQANLQHGAVPLVMRDIDSKFTSYFIVGGDSSAKDITGCKGKKIAFGSKFSTSGHLMPEYFLNEQNIAPSEFFSAIRFSGSHDKTAFLVRDGEVDVGAVNSIILRKMMEDGRLKKDDVRILWETPPYSDYVWAMQPVFHNSVRIKLRDAFLSLSPANSAHAKILDKLSAGSYIPVSSDNFNELRKVIQQHD